MMFPYMIPMFYPLLPRDCNLPPTIYSILDSYVNFGNDEEVSISNLAKNGRECIFDFTYPLSEHITNEEFEVMILNNYLMRRIGYETPTAFKIALNVKLNSIMPIYNKMFDSLENWNLFTDGENITRYRTHGENDTTYSSSSASTTSDSRYSDTPQNRLTDISNGTYMSEYTLDQNSQSATVSSEDARSGNESEIINRDSNNKIEVYKQFQNEIKSIYNLIFDELDELFYSLA